MFKAKTRQGHPARCRASLFLVLAPGHSLVEVSNATQHLKEVFDSLPEGIVVTDPEDRVVLVNPMATVLLGVPEETLLGRRTEAIARTVPHMAWIFEDESVHCLPCWEILACGHKECGQWGRPETTCWAAVPSCSVCRGEGRREKGFSGECERCEVPRLRFSQREREVQGTAARPHCVLQASHTRIQSASGGFLGKVYILRDVTKEREFNRIKDDFLSIISHELRNPLTSIRSYSEILVNYPDTDLETQKEFLRIIAAESDKLDQMIEEIAELRRLESTTTGGNNRKVSLEEIFKKAMADRGNALKARNISWSVSIEPDCPLVWVDVDKILQVIGTLLRVIEKAAPGGSELKIRARPMEGKRERDADTIAHISMTCTARPEGEAGQDAKQRTWALTVEKRRGEGLGFVLCKKILDQYGGNLWTETDPSMNAYTFHFTLPSSALFAGELRVEEARREEELKELAAAAVRKSPEIEKSKKRILVVDDDPSIVNAMVFALTREGYGVHSATSARTALDLVKEVKPDLIISDISMPEMNGYEFFRHLQDDEATKMIPFIFASAKDEPTDLVLGFKTGVDDYLCKPFKIPELLARIERLLSRVEMYKDLARFDSLTGALTRRSFEETMEKEIQRAIVTGKPLSVAMTDLDRFKAINDSYGHVVGDFVLSSFVEFLKKNLRDEDTVARYGGEEFFIIMPDVSKNRAVEVIERLRKSLNETAFYYEKERCRIKITSSFGLSGFPEDGASFESLVLKADQALYLAKRLGRNMVVPFTEEVKMGGSVVRVG